MLSIPLSYHLNSRSCHTKKVFTHTVLLLLTTIACHSFDRPTIMRRVITHLLTAAAILGTTAGDGADVKVKALVSRPEPDPPSAEIVARRLQILSNTINALGLPIVLNGQGWSNTVNALGLSDTVNGLGTTLGGVGGLLNATTESVNDILTPTLQALLTMCDRDGP